MLVDSLLVDRDFLFAGPTGLLLPVVGVVSTVVLLEPEVFGPGALLACLVVLALPFFGGSGFVVSLLGVASLLLLGGFVFFLALLTFCFGSVLAGLASTGLLLLALVSACFVFLVPFGAAFALAVDALGGEAVLLAAAAAAVELAVLLFLLRFGVVDDACDNGIMRGGTVGCRVITFLTLLPGLCCCFDVDVIIEGGC